MKFKTVEAAHCGLPGGHYSLKDFVGTNALVLTVVKGSGIDKGSSPRILPIKGSSLIVQLVAYKPASIQ